MSKHVHLELKCDDETFSIRSAHDGFRLRVDPANRHNGTQSYDGWFGSDGRSYKRVQDAKSGLTKFLGLSEGWVDKTKP
tara:strand:+ start:126653 stop:126889 length:237 start_codon:yes stop_codon:yes gene_type:complete